MTTIIPPRLPKGMRDFLPDKVIKREYVFSIIRDAFHVYGFEPIQTPMLEMAQTLMGKYGEDAEKLIYLAQHPGGKEELALRYDLTVPLARFVAQHYNEIRIPFKRYHLAPVWRAERPQRGRYREFYQCDADIVGIGSMSADAEILSLMTTIYDRIGFQNYSIKINNRKLLTGMGIYAGVPDEQLGDLYRSVDKFDKIGADGVEEELRNRGIASDAVERMMHLILIKQQGIESLDITGELMRDIPEAQEGLAELRELAEHLNNLNVAPDVYEFDFTMVRGLGYYTGPIFETIITEPNLGSITGGGRYDGLIGLFRKESLPTTGMSLGIERIIDLMDEFDLYPPNLSGTVVQVLVTVFNDETRAASTQLVAKLRGGGIHTELVMEDRKLGKQFQYADKKNIPIVAVLGPNEIAENHVRLRRLQDGEEQSVEQEAVVEAVRTLLS